MDIWTLDFETYFSKQYTLKKLTTEEYVRDERFETLLLGVRSPAGEYFWVEKPAVPQFLASVDWSKCAILAHHAHFDGLILSHHYGVTPHAWIDSLGMARLVVGPHVRVGLDSLAALFNLKGKTVPYEHFEGRNFNQCDRALLDKLGAGCCHDVQLTWDIFNKLSASFPVGEYRINDFTIRMFTEPCLRADLSLLGEVWHEENKRRTAFLAELDVTAKDLASAEKFSALLRAEGVEPAMKAGRRGPIPALAQNDDFMRSLADHASERVQMLAEMRLAQKSTGGQTRAERYGNMATRGALCVYLLYCGAHTTRWSGGDKSNFQNLKRGSKLRKAILPPEGHALSVVDLSQIECRLLNFIAGQWDVIEAFEKGADPYTPIASKFYGEDVRKPSKADPPDVAFAMSQKRGTGKQLELSCGYGAGAETIKQTAKLGIYGPPVYLSDEQSIFARDLYRSTHPEVVALWKEAEKMLFALERRQSFLWRRVLQLHDGKIYLPNGTALNYQTLHRHQPEDGEKSFWRLQTRKGFAKMYGAKLVENVIQALARVVISDAMLAVYQKHKLRPVMTAHDEIVYALKKDGRELSIFDGICTILKTPPAWLPGIPLDAEGGVFERYEK